MDLREEKTPQGIIFLDMDDEDLCWVVEIHGKYAADKKLVQAVKVCVETEYRRSLNCVTAFGAGQGE